MRDFCQFAFDHVGLDWEKYVNYDDRYERPTEVDALIGDAAKAQDLLGWKARTLAPELSRLMVEADQRTLLKTR